MINADHYARTVIEEVRYAEHVYDSAPAPKNGRHTIKHMPLG